MAEASHQGRVDLTWPAEELEYRMADKDEDLVKSPILGATGVTRSELWSQAQTHERRGNSVVGSNLKVALPHELDEDEHRELLVGYANHLSEELRVVVDFAYHAKREGLGPGHEGTSPKDAAIL